MPTTKIADKTTLDAVYTNTGLILTRDGIKTDGTDTYIYNPTTGLWVKVDLGGGGGASPTLIVINKNNSLNNKDITVTSADNLFTKTTNMGTNNYITFSLPWLGNYIVSYSKIPSGTYTINVTVSAVGGTTLDAAIQYSSFSECSNSDLSTMLTMHYNDEIDLSTIWSVADTKTISLSAMSAIGVGESHAAQNVVIAIKDFNHNNLVTPINGHTKAILSLGQVDCLKETGYMNSTNTNTGSWGGSARRNWCNNIYYNALPSGIKSLVKPVNIITAKIYNGTTNETTQDYCYLYAVKEIIGGNGTSEGSGTGYSNLEEYQALTQYPYYATSSRRIKKVNGSANMWWERSPYCGGAIYFCGIDNSGNVGGGAQASGAYGIAPGFDM